MGGWGRASGGLATCRQHTPRCGRVWARASGAGSRGRANSGEAALHSGQIAAASACHGSERARHHADVGSVHTSRRRRGAVSGRAQSGSHPGGVHHALARTEGVAVSVDELANCHRGGDSSIAGGRRGSGCVGEEGGCRACTYQLRRGHGAAVSGQSGSHLQEASVRGGLGNVGDRCWRSGRPYSIRVSVPCPARQRTAATYRRSPRSRSRSRSMIASVFFYDTTREKVAMTRQKGASLSTRLCAVPSRVPASKWPGAQRSGRCRGNSEGSDYR